jgi:hypothetical protein
MLLLMLVALLINPPADGKDFCHVYVVDVEKARLAMENFKETGDERADAKALSAGQTIFPEFQPATGEEELTTKHYPFPAGNFTITASVYYTDESMDSRGTGEFAENPNSIVLGIMAGPQRKANALDATAGDTAVAEATYDPYTNRLRARKFLRVAGRLYLMGLECECHRK